MKDLAFVFPRHPLYSTAHWHFETQMEAMKEAGFRTVLDSPIKWSSDAVPSNFQAIYRGWMMTAEQYAAYVEELNKIGVALFTELDAYLSAHYLPGWYDQLADLTFETRFCPSSTTSEELEKFASELGWKWFVLKDWVKSFKTSTGVQITNAANIAEHAKNLEKSRRQIEGGFSIRRWAPLKPNTERRYFVINGKPYASGQEKAPDIVNEVASRIKSNNFFSVDVVENAVGQLRVVEIGDGQVSDLVGDWSDERFAQIWKEAAGG